jgi:type II secretory pathway pseudopilin PulG
MNKRLRGFSLIEALIVTATLSLILGAIFGVAYKAQVSFDAEKRFTETSQRARIAMDEIVRYIRQAGNDPFPKDGFSFLAVERVSGSEINVRSDITGSYDGQTGDPDHVLTSPMEDVTIRYDSVAKQISIIDHHGPLQTLGDNIEIPSGESFFQCYDSAGNLTTVSSDIVSVEVTMAAKTPPRAGSGINTVTYRSHVFIRSKSFDVFATP